MKAGSSTGTSGNNATERAQNRVRVIFYIFTYIILTYASFALKSSSVAARKNLQFSSGVSTLEIKSDCSVCIDPNRKSFTHVSVNISAYIDAFIIMCSVSSKTNDVMRATTQLAVWKLGCGFYQ